MQEKLKKYFSLTFFSILGCFWYSTFRHARPLWIFSLVCTIIYFWKFLLHLFLLGMKTQNNNWYFCKLLTAKLKIHLTVFKVKKLWKLEESSICQKLLEKLWRKVCLVTTACIKFRYSEDTNICPIFHLWFDTTM